MASRRRKPCDRCGGRRQVAGGEHMGRVEWLKCSGCGGTGRQPTERDRLKAARRAYLASKPRCACGRVAVQSPWADVFLCRRHREPEDLPDLDDCMCYWPRVCSGLGVIECSGCGGDSCVCICGGGPIECDGCRDCNYGRGDDDFDEPGMGPDETCDGDGYPF